MTTTVTKTLIKPDGTMETTQYTTFTKASEFGESILKNKPETTGSNDSSTSNESNETLKKLEEKINKNIKGNSEKRSD